MKQDHQFEIFKAEVDKCVKAVGFTEWAYKCRRADIGEGPIASLSGNVINMFAWISLNTKLPADVGDADIASAARHEVGHLLIAKLEHLARTRYIQEDEILAASEQITRKLEKVLG